MCWTPELGMHFFLDFALLVGPLSTCAFALFLGLNFCAFVFVTLLCS
jgi:hypothetical protein